MINGFLVGLVVKDTVEITDCFPLPMVEEDTGESRALFSGFYGYFHRVIPDGYAKKFA